MQLNGIDTGPASNKMAGCAVTLLSATNSEAPDFTNHFFMHLASIGGKGSIAKLWSVQF